MEDNFWERYDEIPNHDFPNEHFTKFRLRKFSDSTKSQKVKIPNDVLSKQASIVTCFQKGLNLPCSFAFAKWSIVQTTTGFRKTLFLENYLFKKLSFEKMRFEKCAFGKSSFGISSERLFEDVEPTEATSRMCLLAECEDGDAKKWQNFLFIRLRLPSSFSFVRSNIFASRERMVLFFAPFIVKCELWLLSFL